jgi:hypothetical protein
LAIKRGVITNTLLRDGELKFPALLGIQDKVKEFE